jgi:uncharacterized glyoxalase superfamily protein PhnB
MVLQQMIPVFRIFDEAKAMDFYIGWLRFSKVWEHRFEEGTPVYMEIEKDGFKIHLSEHHGDATPGSKVFIWCKGLKEFHRQLLEQHYKYNRPGLEETFYGTWCVDTIDPFGNRLSFNEIKEADTINQQSAQAV